MDIQALKKSNKLIFQPIHFEIKYFIFFLWGFFIGIYLYQLEWPIPLQGTVFKIYTSNKLPVTSPKNPDPNGNLVKVACLVSPQIIKYIDQKQEVSFLTDALGNIQKNRNVGTIVAINRNPIQNQKSVRYVVECEINNPDILLKNGFKAKFIRGMKVNGHFYLNRKKMIEFFLDQLDQWLCPSPLRGT